MEKTIYVQIFTFYAPESTWKNIVKKLLTKCCSLSGILVYTVHAADDGSLLVSSQAKLLGSLYVSGAMAPLYCGSI